MKSMLQICIALLILFAPLVLGQNLSNLNGVHQHDGFFLRMLGGFGYAELVEKEVLGSDLKLSGRAAATRFQIGGTVSDNLIIYGEFGGVGVPEPEMEWMGETTTVGNLSANVFDFGGGITYYLMPTNIYFSLSLHASQAQLEYYDKSGKSKFGFGFNAIVGKEWWIADEWALGAAVYGYYSTMNDEANFYGLKSKYTINNFSIGVLFSATYN